MLYFYLRIFVWHCNILDVNKRQLNEILEKTKIFVGVCQIVVYLMSKKIVGVLESKSSYKTGKIKLIKTLLVTFIIFANAMAWRSVGANNADLIRQLRGTVIM